MNTQNRHGIKKVIVEKVQTRISESIGRYKYQRIIIVSADGTTEEINLFFENEE